MTFTGLLGAAVLAGANPPHAEGVTLIKSDLQFILHQIKVGEAHAAGGQLQGTGPFQIANPLLQLSVRTVDGRQNNLITTPNQSAFGAADTVFPRLLSPLFRQGEALTFDPDGPAGPAQIGDPTSYQQTRGTVEDSRPRTISNLVVDASTANPAAQAAADRAADLGSGPISDGFDANPDPLFIPNAAPDEGLSAPFNSWFTFFGQFFDHGLDLVNKGGSGTVIVPLKPDDPLIDGRDGLPGTLDDLAPEKQFVPLTRATNQPGPDLIAGDNPATPLIDESADDVHEHINQTTSFVDQNQTYTAHPSHQVFLREFALTPAGVPVATGRMLDGANGGIGNWEEVKEQARTKLGIRLTDVGLNPVNPGDPTTVGDVLNLPKLVTDQYGKFIPGPNGFPQVQLVGGGTRQGDPTANANQGVATEDAVKIGHAFLDDIAHHAAPFGDHDQNPATPRRNLQADADPGTTDDNDPATYDDELLARHFVTGDGRGNENIGLTAVHFVFHAEHNRLVDHIKQVVVDTGDLAFINEWLLTPAAAVPVNPITANWDGERLFQAARFGTEMQYQHLVFEEFGRKVQPAINVFSGIETDVNAGITAEFAHTVYRFGHSMLNENVARRNAGSPRSDVGLIEAFLNPELFTATGGGSDAAAAGSIVRGNTEQVGNEIDEFVTDALRDNLLGLPLDLPTINMARGRDTGIPSLNAARRSFFATTSDSALQPYESWTDFKAGITNPESLVNFIAAYGTHPDIVNASTLDAKRAIASAIVYGANGPDGQPGGGDDPVSVPSDRLAFLNSQAPYSPVGGVTVTGVDDIDFWAGGLAEKTSPFGGFLGATFNFVFETQMEKLQNGDRFYYLGRLAGLNFLTQLEENSFAEMIMRNTDAHHLPHDVFSTPQLVFEAGAFPNDDPATSGDESSLTEMLDGTLRFVGGEHILFGGTNGANRLRSDAGDDTIWGDDGPDRLEGGAGNDALNGDEGDDIITDSFGDDNIKGGAGNDTVNAGPGFDLILTGFGHDFVAAGSDPTETFAGGGDDFVIAGDDADIVFGNEGDDWIEGGAQADLLQGGNGDPFQTDTITGNDVIDGDGGNDDYDSEGGDDIMLTGPGIERNEGMLGFDWVIHARDPQPANADMRFTGLLPPDADNIRDRFDLVEGLSGWDQSDILRGDDRVAAEMIGHELSNAEQIDRIDGLQEVLGAGVNSFTNGSIILGGGGSDLIEGRGGNDLIDGDRWLNVRISVRDANDPNVEIQSFNSMTEFQASVFSGSVNPGQLRIVREILPPPTPSPGAPDVDTAEFSGNRADYTVTPLAGDGSFMTVTDNRPLSPDGSDTLKNVERLKFADQTVEVVDIVTNAPPVGTVNIAPTPPTENVLLTATKAFTDPDINPTTAPDGVNLATLVFTWQVETDPDTWVAAGAGATFTPGDAEVGQRLRVVATFQDGDGVLESVTSAPTLPVVNVNDPATGVPVISDTTPREALPLTVSTGQIADADGMDGVPLVIQWQQGPASGAAITDANAQNIVGANGSTFTPQQAQVGRRLRVRVTFTDNQGTAERVVSAGTAVTGDLFVGTASGETWVGTAGDDSAAGNGGADNLSAGGGNDVVAGGDGDDTVNAGAGDDFIDFAGTNGGFDAIVGGAGVDEVRATSNPTDIGLSSISGVERISAGANPDVRIVGSAAANTLNFGAVVLTGIDSIDGGDGADSITGSAAADVINGQAGGDTLTGGLGADTLDGGTENDSLNGGAAADALTGGVGDDAMNGGADLDAFVYTAAFGNDTISGFDANATGGQDRLDISGLGVTAANFGTRVTIGASPLGGTLITITDGAATVLGTIRLAGVALAAVNATDFILAP